MDQSPLTRQEAPVFFTKKIVTRYKDLFEHDSESVEEHGFWREFFLLEPEPKQLQVLIDKLSVRDLLLSPMRTRACRLMFQNAIVYMEVADPTLCSHSFKTLSIALPTLLAKPYTNPVTDIIHLLASDLDSFEQKFSTFTNLLIKRIQNQQEEALGASVAIASALFHTTLISFLLDADFAEAINKALLKSSDDIGIKALILQGILTSCYKFEAPNPYKQRLSHETIANTQSCHIYSVVYDNIIKSFDSIPAPKWFSLSSFSEDFKHFAVLPRPIDVLPQITLYERVSVNSDLTKQFTSGQCLANFLAAISRMLHHAHRSTRLSTYGTHSLLILLHMLSNVDCYASLIAEQTISVCQFPKAPAVSRKPVLSTILEILSDSLLSNLRKKLDFELYHFVLLSIQSAMHVAYSTKLKLDYSWNALFKLLEFLTKTQQEYDDLLQQVLSILSFAVVHAESLLGDESSLNDLFYKVFEKGELFSALSHNTQDLANLKAAAAHFDSSNTSMKSHRDVVKLIKANYDSLELQHSLHHSLQASQENQRFRESNHKALFKRIMRIGLSDAKILDR